MKGFILKPHEARQLAEGKPVVIWRVMKPQPLEDDTIGEDPLGKFFALKMKDSENAFLELKCPFPVGVPLYGKETWGLFQSDRRFGIYYRADAIGIPDYEEQEGIDRWRSPVQMSYRESRTTLVLSDVRVRRPCDVTEEEAKEMGFTSDEAVMETWWQGYDSRLKSVNRDFHVQVPGGDAPPEWLESPRKMLIEAGLPLTAYDKLCLQFWSRAELYHWVALATPQTKAQQP